MNNQRIIIISNGKETHLMVNGKLYETGLEKIEFCHDCTEGKGISHLSVSTDRIPIPEATEEEKYCFQELLREYTKEQP